VGDIEELALRYRDAGADELVFYDITASPEGRSVDRAWVKRVSDLIDIPFCVAGGIRTVDDAEQILIAGADKISINTPAIHRRELINELSAAFGVQCIVVGIDSQRDADGEWRVRRDTGSPEKMRSTHYSTLDWVTEVQARGAGEIVLNCIDSDGVRKGYDIPQLQMVRRICHVPLIASGGAGNEEDFAQVFHQAGVDGALAASVFHSGAVLIPALKAQLKKSGIEVRHAE